MSNSRGKNAIINIGISYFAQLGNILLTFIGRKVFLFYLSVDYLGINGLYSNVLTVLSLAELGLDSALVYSLYKPAAEGNNELLSSLVFYFKKIYICLACIIMVIGLALVPILNKIVNSDLPQQELVGYYIIFLVNTVVSYFSAHKVAMLSAFQENRYHKLALVCGNVVKQFIQVIVLICFQNYYLYIGCMVLTTIVRNVILTYICDKRHPEIKKERIERVFDKKPIIERVRDTFVYKIGVVLINNTDNILISMLVSTAAVGIYSNYCIVISSVQSFIATITSSLISGIGNLCVDGSKKRQQEVFDMLLLFYHFVGALGGIGFTLLMNQFIAIWLGNEYMFGGLTACLIAINFYVTTAVSPIWMYREANGMFKKVKYLIVIRAMMNLLLSVVFGWMWGVFGILLATLVSLLMTTFWYEPRLLFKEFFAASTKRYWMKQLKYFVITLLDFCISLVIVRNIGEGLLAFMIKAMLIVICTTVLFWVSCIKSKEYELAKSYVFRKK